MRVDQMGVHLYDGLHVCGRAHVDMGHACKSAISERKEFYIIKECGYTDGVTGLTWDRFSKMADLVSNFSHAALI